MLQAPSRVVRLQAAPTSHCFRQIKSSFRFADAATLASLQLNSNMRQRQRCSFLNGSGSLARLPARLPSVTRSTVLPCRAQPRLTLAERAVSSLQGVDVTKTLTALFATGFFFGPPLDGLHTHVDLLRYDVLPATFGSWKTSLADPLLLGTYYATAGLLLLVADRVLGSERDAQRAASRAGPAWLALNFGVLAAYLQLSSTMYDAGVPYDQMWVVLVAVGAAAWRLTDGTRTGLALALISAAVCPLAEIALMTWAGVWHYPRADFFIGAQGVTSWTACCYAYYTVVVGTLARYLVVAINEAGE